MSGEDDGSIPDEASLLRRIAPNQFVPDEIRGGLRPSSSAFKNAEMSVDVEEILAEHGHDYHFTLVKYPDHYLVKFLVGFARKCEQTVSSDPLPDNPAHALVSGKKRQRIARAFALNSAWVVKPESAD